MLQVAACAGSVGEHPWAWVLPVWFILECGRKRVLMELCTRNRKDHFSRTVWSVPCWYAVRGSSSSESTVLLPVERVLRIHASQNLN